MSLDVQLKAYSSLVDSRLNELLPPDSEPPSELHVAMRYSCLAPGKRLRPILCMAAAEALGAARETVLNAACAIEMVHCFSLIHDDLPAIDNDDMRRGLPTLHVHAGEAMAILAGDALFALALNTLAATAAPPEQVVAAMKCLTHASGSCGLVGGEVVDVMSEGKTVEPENLNFIHARKTGSLIGASCQIGGILAGGTDTQVAALRTYGETIGLAFQIADDVLNETSTSDQLGKSAGSDRERQKATYPALYGVAASRAMANAAAEKAIMALKGTSAESWMLSELARYSVGRMN